MSDNANLNKAKASKDDEFYTMLSDIEAVMAHFEPHFRGKAVLCNCDDPSRSSFWRYFSDNFGRLGLRSLTSTFFDDEGGASRTTMDADGVSRASLEGDGDFRSDECLRILDGCDIVVTNPPFSLLREFLATVDAHGKDMLVLGNVNDVICSKVFPLVMEGRLWLGPPECNRGKGFLCSDGSVRKLSNTVWYTNMGFEGRDEPYPLTCRYDPPIHPMYDGFQAIHVAKASEIPCDYPGIMGVPISFLDKMSRRQFELLDEFKFGSHSPYCLASPEVDGRRMFARIAVRLREARTERSHPMPWDDAVSEPYSQLYIRVRVLG